MKNNVYQFPQGKQREAVRKAASQLKQKRFFANLLKIFSKGIHWIWFSIRLVVASILHTVTGILLALLYGFKGVIIFLGGGFALSRTSIWENTLLRLIIIPSQSLRQFVLLLYWERHWNQFSK